MHRSKLLEKRLKLLKKESSFQWVCEQIAVLDHKIWHLEKRYKKTNQKISVEGVRNIFNNYTYKTAKQIAELRREILGETVHTITDSSTD
ncbi:hypothetical protein ACJMK2_043671 [Sinanodonta woodiana]|uniref:Uncharacterized protein n=1 Tax=Sinanodonta woodiana TaxID=1069815 RepID=A0ABD3VYZ0_SINWO